MGNGQKLLLDLCEIRRAKMDTPTAFNENCGRIISLNRLTSTQFKEVYKKERKAMTKQETNHASHANGRWNRPLPWLWVPMIFVNAVLIVALQCVLLHTTPGPKDAIDWQAHAYFTDSTVLQVENHNVSDGSGVILYREADGSRKLVRIDRNVFFDRWGVVPWTVQTVPQGDEPQTVRVPSYAGWIECQVRDGSIQGLTEMLVYRTRGKAAAALGVGGLLMQGAEATVLALWRKRKSARA